MAKRTSSDEKIEQVDDVGTGTCPAVTKKAAFLMEVIDGFSVHAAASVMPAMPEKQFADLVESIAKYGLGEPIEFKEDLLVEGRHRLKAIVLLRERGITVEIRKAAWQPLPGETVADYVGRKNLHRRHMTDGQRLQCAAELHVMADAERAGAGHEAGRIQPGEVRNPGGSNQYTSEATKAEGETHPTPPSDRRARNKAKTARSAAGRLAAETGQSIHRARQAIAVQKNGTLEEIEAVKSGLKTQPEVLKEIAARTGIQPVKKKHKPIDHPFTPTTPLQHDLLAGWVRLRDSKVAVNERAQAVADMRAILDAEEGASQSSKASSDGAAAKPNRQSARGKGGTK
jgi:hypothetical protein